MKLPRIMGHRGAADSAPENTLASIRKAAELGATWVEFDVMLTGDGVPVLFHDDSLKRITGRDALMVETPYATLRELDAGGFFGPEFAGEPIPSLESALALIVELGLHPNIEIKPTLGRDVETAKALVEVTAKCWPDDRPAPLISSFSRMGLAVARVLRPDWPLGLVSHRVPKDWQAALQALGCLSLHVNRRYLNRAALARLQAAGYQVACFTVKRERHARELLAWGVDCLITPVPEVIATALAQTTPARGVSRFRRSF